jgi:hypothetical protein
MDIPAAIKREEGKTRHAAKQTESPIEWNKSDCESPESDLLRLI